MEMRTNGSKPEDPEVVERAARRRFTPQYKLKILREAERCPTPGEVGALLRREGLYSSNLSAWRKQREAGALALMSATKRGRQPKLSAQDKELARLRQELERLRKKLGQAEKIIEVQKKLSEVLGVSLEGPESERRK
jgi:transposase-like protein